jgi:hypothetical protein
MPKIVSTIEKNRFLIPLSIFKIEKDNNIIENRKLEFKKVKEFKTVALIDTGATHSVISSEIVKKLNLEPIGKLTVSTGSSNADEVNTYNVLLEFPCDLVPVSTNLQPDGNISVNWQPTSFVSNITRVSDNNYIHSQGIESIIGMDILANAHISMVQGNIIISF